MSNKLQEIRKVTEWAKPHPYTILWYNDESGQGVGESDVLEWLSYLLSELDDAKNEVLVSVDVIKRLESNYNLQHENYKSLVNETVSLQQQLDAVKQEIASHGPEGRNYTNAQYVELLQKYEAAKQENERLRKLYEREREIAENAVNIQSGYMNHLHQRLKQAIEALEKIANVTHGGTSSALYAQCVLSIFKEEANPPYMARGSLG